MSLRTLLVLGLLGLAVSAPIFFSGHESEEPAPPNGIPSGTASYVTPTDGDGQSPNLPFALATSQSAPIYYPAQSFGEIFRFDVNPEWIMARWPRVSNCEGEDQLIGLRVPLVTGPRPVDIHGSLTYYFDDSQRVQRINFKGWTGDSRELVSLVSNQHGFSKQKSRAAGLYLKKSWGKPIGVLRLDYPPVIQRDLPNQQLMVLLEINNPKGKFGISDQVSRVLAAMD